MKVILIQDIKSLGKKGDIKDVSEGYARNFLFPKRLAQIASDSAMKSVVAQKEKERKAAQDAAQKLMELSQILKGKEFVIKSKGMGGKLFGSVSAKDIAAEIRKNDIAVDEKMVRLPSPIKKTGQYPIEIKFGENIFSEIKLLIEEEK